MSFTAVQFSVDEGGTIAVVHSSGLTPLKREVFWPPVKSGATLKQLLLAGKQADTENWKLYGISKCFFSGDDYDKAEKKLKLLEETSDIFSESEEETTRKRKRVAKRIIYESDESDDTLPRPPKVTVKAKSIASTSALVQGGCSYPSPRNSTPYLSQSPSSHQGQSEIITSKVNYNFGFASTPGPQVAESTDNSEISCSHQHNEPAFQIKLLKQLKFLQQQNSQILALLSKQSQSLASNLKISTLPENLPCDFPVEELEKLQDFEEYLKDAQNNAYMVR
ncbi:uncharacterized protein LOC123314489 [Coccinella septempunctata]|uniref:uncharacterized protein LOC123314489 n=1 Tax=Coccinella septempunctata TaxID=41139 RepID=UPI001D0842A1|nr:uncharacterized protein LOC123314489 [Coccinella septempunctata]